MLNINNRSCSNCDTNEPWHKDSYGFRYGFGKEEEKYGFYGLYGGYFEEKKYFFGKGGKGFGGKEELKGALNFDILQTTKFDGADYQYNFIYFDKASNNGKGTLYAFCSRYCMDEFCKNGLKKKNVNVVLNQNIIIQQDDKDKIIKELKEKLDISEKEKLVLIKENTDLKAELRDITIKLENINQVDEFKFNLFVDLENTDLVKITKEVANYNLANLKFTDFQNVSKKLRELRDLPSISTVEIQKSLFKEEENLRSILEERKVSMAELGPRISIIVKIYNRLLLCEEVQKEINVKLNKIKSALQEALNDM